MNKATDLSLELAAPDPDSIATSGVIVSGASSGLGRATALLLANAGRPVAVWGRNEKRVNQVMEECSSLGVAATGVAFDIGDEQAVSDAVDKSQQALGRIGSLALCHGISPAGQVGKLNFKVLNDCIQTNLNGVAYTIEAALPALRAAGKGASIVAALSTSALRAAPTTPEYNASKHGALGLIRAASRTLGAEGIRVNAVCPGAMDTPMMVEALASASKVTSLPEEDIRNMMLAAIPLGYASNPFEVARVVCFMISPAASYVNGAAIPVDGGMIA